MRWTTGNGRRWWVLGLLCALAMARAAHAIYLDEDEHISLRARIYSQGTIRIEDSEVGITHTPQGEKKVSAGTLPTTKAGQLVQHRNFFNPELEGKLTSYTSWMRGTFLDILAPDEFSVRLAGWAFYDGIYDYGASQFDDAQKVINSTFGSFAPRPRHSWILEGPKYNPKGKTIADIFPGSEVQNPRDIYANQRRINELYFSYGKGPFFLRVGKQAISWGESDTIAILDQNNPFDLTVGAPGLFEDLDEARLPLWTVRSSLTLFDTLGPLSSGFIEGYWVPGDLDVNTGILPIRDASPYSPRGSDPQDQLTPNIQALLRGVQFVLLDHVPRKRFENSRAGFRTQTIVNRTHTLSAWVYTHFPSSPVPRTAGITRVVLPPGQTCGPNATANNCQVYTVETVHKMTPVVGLSDTFFFEPLDGIVRAEAEYFIGEPSFTPEDNLQIKTGGGLLDPIQKQGTVPRANYLRWEVGFDRFFFLRPLNPSNSFVWVTALVGSYNLDETSQKDFRASGQFNTAFLKKFSADPSSIPIPRDFTQQKKVEIFAQTHLGTDYLHGRLSPSITMIFNARGTYAIQPDLIYRWTDYLLFEANLLHIGGEYQSLGFFRDRDQLWGRATLQLN